MFKYDINGKATDEKPSDMNIVVQAKISQQKIIIYSKWANRIKFLFVKISVVFKKKSLSLNGRTLIKIFELRVGE